MVYKVRVPQEDLDAAAAYLATARERVLAAARTHGYANPEITVDIQPWGCFIRFFGMRGALRFVYLVDSHGRPVEQKGDVLISTMDTERLDIDLEKLEARVRAGAVEKPQRPPIKLYWVADDQNEDDWFVVARAARDARKWYAYDIGDSSMWMDLHCELIATLPPALQKVDDEVYNAFDEREAGWPTHEAIEACGGRIVRQDQPRIVELGGRPFAEGMLDFKIEQGLRGAAAERRE